MTAQRSLSFLLFFLLSAATVSLAQSNDPALVTVHVSNVGHEPVPAGTLIEAVDGSGVVVAQGRTDGNADAMLGRMEPGCYRFRAANFSAADATGPCLDVSSASTPIVKEIYISGANPRMAPSADQSKERAMVSTASLGAPEAARSELAKATAALGKSRFGEAEKRIKNALKAYPNYPEAHNLLGTVYLMSGETVSAKNAFATAIKIDPKFGEAYRNLSRIAAGEEDFKEAEQQLRQALAANPRDGESWTLLAFAQYGSKQYEATIQSARQAHAFDQGRSAAAHFVASSALEKQGRFPEAADELRQYLQEDADGRYAARSRELLKRYAARAR